jgi:hypothetical protein
VPTVRQAAGRLVPAVATATAASPNEQSLRHEIENRLEAACMTLDIPWTAYQLDRTLRVDKKRAPRFVDVVHGAVVIEYEPPSCFKGREGVTLNHARGQAEEYTELLSDEEGRALTEYVLVAWDGASISFGRHTGTAFVWEPVEPFERSSAERLLTALQDNGVPLVHPQLLGALIGPASTAGTSLLPAFYTSLTAATMIGASTTKTQLLFVEWKRLFGVPTFLPPYAPT